MPTANPVVNPVIPPATPPAGAKAGFFDSGMSDSPTSARVVSSTKTTSNAFDPNYQASLDSARSAIDTAFSKPWEKLTNQGQYFAPTTAAQTKYFTDTKNLTGPAQYDQSGNLYTGAGSSTFNQAQADQYMSPYQNAVTQTTMAEMQRQHDRELAQLGLRNVQGAGLGSSGFALSQALANQNYGRDASAMYAKLQQQAYENAMAQYNAEQNRRIQAAQGLASLGANVSASDLARLAAQGGAATQEYNLAQRLNDLKLREDSDYREAAMKMATNRANAIGAMPHTSTETSVIPNETTSFYGIDPSVMQTIIGGAGGILDLVSKGGDVAKGARDAWDTISDFFGWGKSGGGGSSSYAPKVGDSTGTDSGIFNP